MAFGWWVWSKGKMSRLNKWNEMVKALSERRITQFSLFLWTRCSLLSHLAVCIPNGAPVNFFCDIVRWRSLSSSCNQLTFCELLPYTGVGKDSTFADFSTLRDTKITLDNGKGLVTWTSARGLLPVLCSTINMAASPGGSSTSRKSLKNNFRFARQKSREARESSDSDDEDLFDSDKIKTRLMSMWNNVRHGE